MNSPLDGYQESLLAKTKIVATLGPACNSPDLLRQMVIAGVDIFRLNFAHGKHEVLAESVVAIRQIAAELDRSVGILGDLGGPKIRLGDLPGGSIRVDWGEKFTFVHETDPDNPAEFSTTYDGLIDDLQVDDPVLLADGTVALRVVEKHAERAVCVVEQPGLLRSGREQGIGRLDGCLHKGSHIC